MEKLAEEAGSKGVLDPPALQAISATLTQAFGDETFEGLDPSLANLMIQLSHVGPGNPEITHPIGPLDRVRIARLPEAD